MRAHTVFHKFLISVPCLLVLMLVSSTFQMEEGSTTEIHDSDVQEEVHGTVLSEDYDDQETQTLIPEFDSPVSSSSISILDDYTVISPDTSPISRHDGQEVLNEKADGAQWDQDSLGDGSKVTPSDENGTEPSVNETKPLRTIALCSPHHPVLSENMLEPIEESLDSLNSESQGARGEEVDSAEESAPVGEEEGARTTEQESIMSKVPLLRLVNTTELFQDVLWSNTSIKSRMVPANCSAVLFYAPWCPFSAKAAPHVNALPRAFPGLRVAAIDVSRYTSVNSYFGILSVPTMILFHNGKSFVKFNETSFTLNNFADFIQAYTDLRSDERINVTSQDFNGPLPSSPTKVVDYYLILAWVFIATCFLYYVTKSSLWRRAIDLVRTTWREAEDHVHQD